MNKGILSLVAAVCCGLSAQAAATVELVSRAVGTSTQSANGGSLGSVYSADGKFILFSSTAPDLVNLPTKGHFQLYAVNATNGTVELISSSTNGTFANSGAF